MCAWRYTHTRLSVIKTWIYSTTMYQASIFTWLHFFFLQEKQLCIALFFMPLPPERQTAQWRLNKVNARMALAHSANCRWDPHAGAGNNFKSLGCETGVKRIFGFVVFYCTSSFSGAFIHQKPKQGPEHNLLGDCSNRSSACRGWRLPRLLISDPVTLAVLFQSVMEQFYNWKMKKWIPHFIIIFPLSLDPVSSSLDMRFYFSCNSRPDDIGWKK